MTMWRSRALAAITLAGASALLAAAPARAAGATWITPTQTESVSTIPNPSFVSQWDVSPDFLDHISMTVWFVPPGQSAPDTNGRTPIPVNGHQTTICSFPQSSSDPTHAVSSGQCSVPAFTASLNGTYYAESAGYFQCLPPGTACLSGDGNSMSYVVNAPPVAPTGLAASYDNAARKVNLVWNTNNREPDLIDYVVLRQINGDTPSVIATVTSASYTDTDTGNGGSFDYSVVAERAGTNGAVASEPSTPASASVPPPPTPTTSTDPAAGGPPGPGGTTSTTKLIAPGLKPPSNYTPSKLDLSQFAAALNAAKAKHGGTGDNGGITASSEADNGYKSQLPYGSAAPNANSSEDGPQAASAPLTRASANGKDNVRTAAAVAGGLLAIVLAMHGMWLRAEVKRAGLLEAVEPEPLATPQFRDFWFASDEGPGGG